jgi:glycosyltransferase involved in cell wall biosynthesis
VTAVIESSFPTGIEARVRIGFDARYINDRYHGIGRYAFRMLESLIAASPEHTFIIFRGNERDSRFEWNSLSAWSNVQFQPGPRPLYWPQEQLLWPWILHKNRIDVFHSPYFVAPLFTSLPSIITIHDLIFDRYPDYMPMAWSRPYYHLLMEMSVRRAQRIVAVSRATAHDLGQFYHVPDSKVEIIPEGVEPAFRPLSDPDQALALRARYKLENPYILTVGARRPHKNHVNLLRSFAGLAADFKHDLVFAGPADQRFPDKARALASQLGLLRRVRFLDWVPEEDLPALYSQADLVVLPSVIEGFGLPALEAMACGTSVIAANNSSFPEVIANAGLLVDPTDISSLQTAIARLLSTPSLRRHLSHAGRQRAAHFTWDATASRIRNMYQSLFQERRLQLSQPETPPS